jgi:hypothetical protein
LPATRSPLLQVRRRSCATTARRGGSDIGNRLEAALLHKR